jgi:hypothetical protein
MQCGVSIGRFKRYEREEDNSDNKQMPGWAVNVGLWLDGELSGR